MFFSYYCVTFAPALSMFTLDIMHEMTNKTVTLIVHSRIIGFDYINKMTEFYSFILWPPKMIF